ncbi:MAG: hypothetical protein V3T21_04750 [Candidatus Margulisiibacteriota bacterium]
MAKKPIFLVVLLVAVLGYAVYTYLPLVTPYISGLLSKQPEKLEIKKEVPPAKPAEGVTTTTQPEVKEERAPKAVKPKKLADPFALRVAVTSKEELEAAKARAAKGKKEAPKKPSGPELNGIWVGSGLKAAFISGQVMTEGATIMGWRVVRISRTSVVLRKGRRTKTLKLGGE